MVIGYLIEKEFKQLVRNSFLPRLIVFMPVLMMLILPWAANMEIKDLHVSVVDNDHTSYSRRLIQKIGSSDYFKLSETPASYRNAMYGIEQGSADLIVEIPSDFEKKLMRKEHATVSVSVNAVNGTKGGIGSSYLRTVITSFAAEIAREGNDLSHRGPSTATIDILPLNKFNLHMDYKVFMVPALMVMLLTLLCGFLPALNIVGEKESGTIEQINVTPIGKFTFILAKLIPYWIVGFLVLTLCFGLARFVYGLIPLGNIGTIYVSALLFVLTVSGLGLVISNNSGTMQQAMFIMFFFMIIMILISGLFTPVESMPEWAQKITVINPLKYFIRIMRQVYLKGSGLRDFGASLTALGCFALVFNLWAVLSYRKKS